MNDKNIAKNHSDLPGHDGVWQKLPLLSSSHWGNSREMEKVPKYTEIMVWLRTIPGFLQPQGSSGATTPETSLILNAEVKVCLGHEGGGMSLNI